MSENFGQINQKWKKDEGEICTKKKQVDYIAPLNHLPLLPSGPGGVQQELVV
jgi:hypothetical protein